jgi:hypothetical protein
MKKQEVIKKLYKELNEDYISAHKRIMLCDALNVVNELGYLPEDYHYLIDLNI